MDLARMIGEDPSTLNKLVRGRNEVSERWAQKLAPALGVPIHSFYEPVGSPIPWPKPKVQNQEVARMAAIRRAWWPNPAVAAQALGVTLEKLEAQESGAEPVDREYLFALMRGTNCPPGWITDGDISGLDGHALILIALDSPELVPAVSGGVAALHVAPDDESTKSSKASGASKTRQS